MSYVTAASDLIAAAATDLGAVKSALTVADAAASAQTTALLAPGSDEVSAAVAALFATHGRQYQALSAQPRPADNFTSRSKRV